MRPPARFELLTRSGCHLCDEMASVLEAVLPAEGLSWVAVDIDRHPDLRERYSDVVPVLLRDGRPVAKLRLDRDRLRRIIGRRRFFGRRR